MRKDRKALYALSVSVFIVLLLALFLPYGGSSRIIAALLLLSAAAITHLLLKKRAIPRVERRQVLLLMGVIGLLLIVLYYLSGLHFRFYRNAYAFSLPVLLRYIFPTAAVILATEHIRSILLAQNSRLATVFVYLSAVTAELLLLTNIPQVRTFANFMDLVGLTLLPAVTANLLYCYVSKHYGAAPNILYRLLISLHAYLLPITPAIPDPLYAFARLLLPLFIYFFLRLLYEKRQSTAHRQTSKWSYVGIGAIVVVLLGIVMIVSCQFRIGALVVATESMTGELNKGDVAVYERYDDQAIKEGQVIVFNKGNRVVIHRVIDIKHINGTTRYYTQGDANDDPDLGFITDSDIIGLTNVKIPYLGYPTLWLRELFAKN